MHQPSFVGRFLFAAGAVALCLASALASGGERPKVEFLNSANTEKVGLPFSDAVRNGDTLYLSGQVGVTPGTRQLVAGGFPAEARQALANINAILIANGRTTADLVKCTVLLADMADWPAFNEIYSAFLKKPYPARSAIGASGLALGARVEVECIASAAP